MERKILQDIVPSSSRTKPSLRDRLPKENLREEKRQFIKDDKIPNFEREVTYTRTPNNYNPHKKTFFGKFFLWISIALSILVLFFAFSLMYSNATVEITPKVQNVSIDGLYTAKRDAKAGELQYEVMTITKQLTETVEAKAGKQIETKSVGKVTLYNNFSEEPQILLISTRLESPKGLIYKTNKQVTIPGTKKTSGSIVPGTIDVEVTASESGSVYNGTMEDLSGDFKIVGFKGTPRYEGFYAKLKTDLTGGFVGVSKTVDSKLEESTRAELRDKLKKELLTQALGQVPEEFIMYDNATNFSYSSLDNTPAEGNRVVLNEKATMTGIMFNRLALTNHIASKEVAKFGGSIVPFELELLNFNLSSANQVSINQSSPVKFTLRGIFKLVGTFTENDLKKELAGARTKDITKVLPKYGTISNATVVNRPFWKSTFPTKQDKINIITKIK